ncbi:MAG TPA: nucleoside-triphosphatase [Acidobacteriota bacterium]|nr:nucleoside-triphosphatase [Acidobacteriota bacterium]
MITLIEGLPGTGKTTLIQRLSDHWGRGNCTGFFTEEIRRSGGSRTGFAWRTFDGKSGLLADLQPGSPRVGKYRVALESFDAMLPDLTVVKAGKILLIDEVGKMECLSAKFRKLLAVWEALDCRRIFTVPARGTPFIETFKSRNGGYIVQITRGNREELLSRLTQEG